MGESIRSSSSVLVVEDDRDLREVVVRALTRAGYRVREAADGEQALGMVAQHMPDLILLDLRMPGMDGQEFARRLRAEYGGGAAIILMSGTEAVDRVAREFGAQGYLDKPFRIRALLRLVEQHLGTTDARQGPDPPAPTRNAS